MKQKLINFFNSKTYRYIIDGISVAAFVLAIIAIVSIYTPSSDVVVTDEIEVVTDSTTVDSVVVATIIAKDTLVIDSIKVEK